MFLKIKNNPFKLQQGTRKYENMKSDIADLEEN